MTYYGIFIFVILVGALVVVGLTYRRLSKYQAALRLREEEVERYERTRLHEQESADREHAAMLIRMDVSDRWFRHAWPLTQVSLMWAGPQVAVSSEVPAALRYAADEISQNGIANLTCGCKEDAARPLQPGFLWQTVSRVTENGPSFFTDGCGDSIKASVWQRAFGRTLMSESQARVDVILQVTRHMPVEIFSTWLCCIADQLDEGMTDDGHYDDDSGWGFRILLPDSPGPMVT
ncbi:MULTISPECIES: hypothetical protein [unclassified Pantoea]|uniref:hypothetical protein n=1 Tax=unclassified Pantoea TaxID=2630326 RepID=UPI00247760EB|nr:MULTISPECIES: hypothetical protein [unclassified Pantoea]GME47624.1 hypothetical protein ACJ3_43600 [Pantoea sp. QMID3]GME47774.1 hypothetical protein ACJ1_43260 [Pantoea sp. QMID1]GME62618.1 hypothetical protein ACJ4_43860 [Pantoea sp. QMID4]GME63782.1 hypothetical protein ACJ2_43730 [Pantoea sp. QMID2]